MTGGLALARIRAMGARVERAAGGGLSIRPAIPAAVEIARAEKPQIAAQLAAESFDGPCYETSPYRISTEVIYDIAYGLTRFEETKELARKVMAICMEREAEFDAGHERGMAHVAQTAADLTGLAQRIAAVSGYMLEGERLHSAIKREVEAMGRNLGALA